ncbi:hypothetical protein TMM008_04830 [Pseudomonas sp. 008]|nr:hypothetical protein TMM008_04830 [Pseudomonas sp. 008]
MVTSVEGSGMEDLDLIVCWLGFSKGSDADVKRILWPWPQPEPQLGGFGITADFLCIYVLFFYFKVF